MDLTLQDARFWLERPLDGRGRSNSVGRAGEDREPSFGLSTSVHNVPAVRLD